MAGPSVVVRVLGDLTGLSKTLDATATKGASVTSSLQKGFSGVFSAINTTGALSQFSTVFTAVDQGLGQLEESGNRVATAMQAAGGVAAAMGVLLMRAGSTDQAAQQQLAQAVENTGASWGDYQGQVDKAVQSETRYGDTAAQTMNALQTLTQATNDPAKAMNLLGLATDIAAAKHESLTSAATSLAKALTGNTRLLKEMGVTVPKVGDAVGDFATQADQANYVVAELSTKLHGQAAAAADTFMGHVHALGATIENQVATLGQKYGPALTAVGTTVTVLSTGFKTYQSIMETVRSAQEAQAAATKAQQAAMETAKAAQEAQTAVTESQTAATEALTAAETEADVAGAPIELIVLGIAAAVAALAVAAYEIYKNWKTIWAGIKAVIADVWDWIKKNWPLLVDIILGPIAFVVGEVVKHWAFIRDAFIDAFEDIKAYVTGLPASIGKLFENVGLAIVNAFKDAFNAVADLWNNSIGSLSFKIPSWVPLLGGDKFSVPQIPHLAQGGLITQSGLVYAHAGEAITPVNKMGPALHIEHATFNDPIDIELLMKKMEFAVSQGLPA
jgi:hypothetical protein